jgi:hypothetical protein
MSPSGERGTSGITSFVQQSLPKATRKHLPSLRGRLLFYNSVFTSSFGRILAGFA